jgi:hypothetical protein
VQESHSIREVIFEERDTQIFNIPDTKTKLSTLQNYFFPRLETLLRWEHLIFVKTLLLAPSFFLLPLFSWLLTPGS